MSHVVIDHHHNADAGVYRLTIGEPIIDHVITEDNDGEAEEILLGYVDVRDFLFADADDRWKGKTAQEIAAQQRAIVTEALHPPEPEPVAEPRPMPGMGEAL